MVAIYVRGQSNLGKLTEGWAILRNLGKSWEVMVMKFMYLAHSERGYSVGLSLEYRNLSRLSGAGADWRKPRHSNLL
jgi:hypothetical protein